MRRIYTAAPARAEDGWALHRAPTTMIIVETEDTPQFSGLLDSSGARLMVTVRRDPVGFVRFSAK